MISQFHEFFLLFFCRYMAVTRIDYIHGRNCRTIGTMISMIWGIAIIVSLAPLFGWRDPDFEDKVNKEKMCIVSQELSYQLFATLTTFYVPLVIILLLYWRIFMTARTRLRKRLAAKAKVALPVAAKKASNAAAGDTATSASPAIATNATSTNGTHRKESLPKKHSVVVEQNTSGGQPTTRIEIEATAGQASPGNGLPPQTAEAVEADDETKAMLPPARFVSQGCQTDRSMSNHNHFDEKNNSSRNNSSSEQLQQLQQQPAPPSGQPQNNGSGGGQQQAAVKKHVSLEAKRERKAAKTLAIVTGAFIACWLPFFVLALFMAIFGVQHFNMTLVSFFLWLGYFNSTLNPIIYTIFSPEFRTAFKRILCGKSHVLNHRPRHLQ